MTSLKICPSMSEFEELKSRVGLIGGYYSANWTSTGTSAHSVQLTTKTAKLPEGNYVVEVRFPRVGNDAYYWLYLSGGQENVYFRGTSGGRYASIVRVLNGTQLYLVSAQSASATFSNIQEGLLRAVRLTA